MFSPTRKDYIAFCAYASLSTIVPAVYIILRFYTKLAIVRKTDWADYFILVAFINFVVILVTIKYAQWILDSEGNISSQHAWLAIDEALYSLTLLLIKSAIVLQYLQILAPIRTGNEIMYFGGRALLATMLVFYTANMLLVLLFKCWPPRKNWDVHYAGGSCMQYATLIIITSVFNIATDLLTVLLPVRSVSKLRIAPKKKLGIILLFATGLLATLASAVRIWFAARLKKHDPPQAIVLMGVYLWAEIALGICISCTLCLPKLFRAKRKAFSAFFLGRSSSPRSVLSRLQFPWTSKRTGESDKSSESKESISAPPKLDLNSDFSRFTVRDWPPADERGVALG